MDGSMNILDMYLWVHLGIFIIVFSSLLFCDYWEKKAEIGNHPEDHFPRGLGYILIGVLVITALPLANLAAIYLFTQEGIQARKEYYQKVLYSLSDEAYKIDKDPVFEKRLEDRIHDRITIDKESVKKLSPLAQRSLNYILEDLENIKSNK